MTEIVDPPELDARQAALESFAVLVPAVAAGAALGLAVLPYWLPSLAQSLSGPDPKAYWYLARASGVVAFALVWISMLLGLLLSTRLAGELARPAFVMDLHQHVSLTGIAFSALHALFLLGDRFVSFSLGELLLPFSSRHAPVAVGAGQLALYGLAFVTLTFALRKEFGPRFWKLLHRLSFAVFALALAHGLAAGSDGASPWLISVYLLATGSVTFLVVLRLSAPRAVLRR